MEHHGGDGNVVAHAGHGFHQAHAPGAVAGVGDRGPVGRGHLRADDGRKRVAAVAPAHGGEEAARLLEAQVAVGDRVDVADVGGDHHVLGHGLLELAQHLARVQIGPAARGALVLLLPRSCRGCRGRARGSTRRAPSPRRPARRRIWPARSSREASQASVRPLRRWVSATAAAVGVAADAPGDLLDQPEHRVIGVDLDDLGVLGPVVHAVLGQGAEGVRGASRARSPRRRARAASWRPWSPDSRAGRTTAGGSRGRVVVQVAVDHGARRAARRAPCTPRWHRP